MNLGFNLAWELDFWGLYRRQILGAGANLDGSVENYDAVLVTLLSDVSQYYVTMREAQERIELARQNVKLQRDVLKIVQARYDAGTVTELDVDQQQTTLSQTESTIPALEITLRQARTSFARCWAFRPPICNAAWDSGRFPRCPAKWWWAFRRNCSNGGPTSAPPNATPRPRPSKSASRRPIYIPTSRSPARLGWSAQTGSQLFTPAAFEGSVGPSFQWNILNYGRIANNVHLQDAKFQQSLLDYRTAVLTANQEAEDGLIAFLKSQEQDKILVESVVAANKAYQIGISQYRVGTVDFTRLAQIQLTLVQQQDAEAQARGAIALGLVQVYRALGGGWEIRLGQPGAAPASPLPAAPPAGVQNIPVVPVPDPNPAAAPQAPQPPKAMPK